LIPQFEATHNKDYSVVKTFKAAFILMEVVFFIKLNVKLFTVKQYLSHQGIHQNHYTIF